MSYIKPTPLTDAMREEITCNRDCAFKILDLAEELELKIEALTAWAHSLDCQATYERARADRLELDLALAVEALEFYAKASTIYSMTGVSQRAEDALAQIATATQEVETGGVTSPGPGPLEATDVESTGPASAAAIERK